jgi:hypothetical protein
MAVNVLVYDLVGLRRAVTMSKISHQVRKIFEMAMKWGLS